MFNEERFLFFSPKFVPAILSLFWVPLYHQTIGLLTVHYRPKRSFGQGNIFTSVCHSVHRGGWVSQHALQVSPGGVSQHALQVSSPNFFLEGGNFFYDFCFLWGYTSPPGTTHRNTVKVRPVRILLECILVVGYVYVGFTWNCMGEAVIPACVYSSLPWRVTLKPWQPISLSRDLRDVNCHCLPWNLTTSMCVRGGDVM